VRGGLPGRQRYFELPGGEDLLGFIAGFYKRLYLPASPPLTGAFSIFSRMIRNFIHLIVFQI
jgi:hypothetical protein